MSRLKLGKTGDFPRGKLSKDDEGGLRMSIGVDQGNVRIDFGTSTPWIAMPPDQAEVFANTILKHVRSIRRGGR